MQRKRILLLLAVGLCLVFATSVLAGSSPNYRINWMVPLSGAGGGPASSEHYTINYTIGQSMVGAASSESFESTLGYWYQQVSELPVSQWLVRLPELFRDNP